MSTYGEYASSILNGRAERRPLPGLAAYHWEGRVPKLDRVRNISSTGVYLQTPDRWEPGEVVTLTLQREGPPRMGFDNCVRLTTKAVRWGDDGVGLAFDLLDHEDLRLWDSPLKTDASHTQPEDILREFRVASALAFIRRIAPGSANEVRRLLREGLSNYRVESAVNIALKAESLTATRPDTYSLKVNPQVALRILEGGSWAEDEWVRMMWAGLLASSLSPEGQDDSNLLLVNSLGQLTTVHFRILTAACMRASQMATGFGWSYSKQSGCTLEELMKVTGARDKLRIEREIEHLADLGLLEHREKSPSFMEDKEPNVVPTTLGQKLWSSCEGNQSSSAATPFLV
ncbi:MAG TPA: hypothetical protein VG844_16530 [Terracidiphilus sp.]|nr:hypothetical protein [Terracidiphilus sp.]